MSLHIRSLAAALVLALFAGGAAQALPLASSLPAGEGAGVLDSVWRGVSSLSVQAGSYKPEGTREEGGMMDPDGT